MVLIMIPESCLLDFFQVGGVCFFRALGVHD